MGVFPSSLHVCCGRGKDLFPGVSGRGFCGSIGMGLLGGQALDNHSKRTEAKGAAETQRVSGLVTSGLRWFCGTRVVEMRARNCSLMENGVLSPPQICAFK